MPDATFQCPTCEARYKVVRVEAPSTHDSQVLCLSCRGPLQGREGKFALKYLRTMVRVVRPEDVNPILKYNNVTIDLAGWIRRNISRPVRSAA
jgi:hypothetical protein